MGYIEAKEHEIIVEKIVSRISDKEGALPTTLPPLHHTIDPDLIQSLPQRATLTFAYHGYTVTVHGDETITIRETKEGDFDSNA